MGEKPTSLAAYDDRTRAERYERRKGFAPARKERMLEVALDSLVTLTAPQATLLELGAGTGHFTQKVVACNHFGQVHVTDGAAAMLEIAQNKWPNRDDLLRFDIIDFTTDWAGRFAGRRFDAVASMMAIHHADDKLRLFRQVYRVLQPGGLFVLGDHMASDSSVGQYLVGRERALVALGREAQYDPAQIEGQIKLDEWKQAREGNRCESVGQYLAYLSTTGFAEAECLWRDYWLAVFVAHKKADAGERSKPHRGQTDS